MSEWTVALADVRAALQRVGGELCSLVRSGADGGVIVTGAEWTIGDVAAHVALGTEAYVGYVGGATDAFVDVSDIAGGSLARSNAARLEADPRRDLGELADRLGAALSALLDATHGRDGKDAVTWHGQQVALADMLGMGLGEYVLHGRDIATTLSRSWTIRPDDARLVLASALPLLPLLGDPATTAGVHARYDVRIRGRVRAIVTIRDGEMTVTPAGGPVDCHVSADPVALLLIAYGRRSQWVPILTGKLVAWGRKPWLGPRLVRYLVTP